MSIKRKYLFLKLRDTFFTGLFVFIPIAITVWIVLWLLSFVNNLILPYLRYVIPVPDIPGIGIAVTVLLIFLSGIVAQNYFGKKLITLWDRLIDKIPLVRSIYVATKQLMENLLNARGKGKFKEAVLVEFPRKGMLSIGFVANKVKIGDTVYYLVYIPTAPNPTSGYTIFVEEKEVIHTDISVEEATKIILSGGLVTKNRITPL
ncbi:DUF502 domain-containing protein [Persephonella atlantica]|uniref:DUF502 domain-containing protein n=1 Tax=Persephonella atlantica TaxID=2699429 RepID=A0ABS1GFD9_9AQUI|nr:DUF502 domain-containing protein [Persephonella atlantica]